LSRAIFWDLLGTLGGNSHTLINQDFKFFEHALLALKKATENNYLNIIITNQSHIAHDRLSLDEYNQALKGLLTELENHNIMIAEVYTCPHAKKDNCPCKKPQTLLADKAIRKYYLNPAVCYVIGDSGKNDMMLAENLSMKSILVLTGEGQRSLKELRHLWIDTEPTYIAEDSLDAINKVLSTVN